MHSLSHRQVISLADLDPPQTFALRAVEILGNERQTVWRSGRALQAKQHLQLDLACGPRCRAARPYPQLGQTPVSRHRKGLVRGQNYIQNADAEKMKGAAK